jgi:aspartate/methionine/tyrosine aminotransferase
LVTRFSSRFHWNLQPNRLTIALEQRRGRGDEVLDLTQSNPTQAGLEYPPDLAAAFVDDRLLRYEPSPAGMREAREAVAEYYAARRIRVEPERILLTASTSEGYAYLFKLLTDPGDEILVPRPSYPLFEFLANMESVHVRPYSLIYDGRWSIDAGSLRAALTDRTRAIVLVNPNNPTGSYVKRSELDWLLQVAAERAIALIADEVFSDYAFGPDGERIVTLAPVEQGLVFSMSGLSKVGGLPQMKLGWIVASGAADARRQAYERLEWIADTYLSVGTPVQCAASRLLATADVMQGRIRERLQANLKVARTALEGSAGTLLTIEGGWYSILQVPRIRTEEEWALALLEKFGVLVQPGYFYDFEGEAFLVVSLLTAPEILREGFGRVRKCIDVRDLSDSSVNL